MKRPGPVAGANPQGNIPVICCRYGAGRESAWAADPQPLVGDVGEATLPEAAPYRLSAPNFSQMTIVARDPGQAHRFDSGNYDMHTANETGPEAGRHLFTVFESGPAGIQRTDLRTMITTTLWHSPSPSPALDSHVACDAKGNIYVMEDQPGGVEDIWFAQDENEDGVAEAIGKWASLSTKGAESTGLCFDKFEPNVAYINVQHPDSGVDRTIMIRADQGLHAGKLHRDGE